MKTLAFYALEVLVCSGVLLAAYAILLERRVRFRWCRAYLLAITPLAAVIPLLRIPVWPGEVIEVVPTVDLPQEWTAEVVETAAPTVTPETACLAIYLLGAALIAGMMLWQVLCIRRLRRSAGVTRTDRFTLVRTPQRIASFSFFRTIYVWEQTPPGELQAIIAHEASHIAHCHSVERIGMECMKALLWWNPFVWITARRLTEAEEFEADSDVLDNGFDIEHYMNAIFKQMFGYSPEIANSLRDSLTKKRFKMMTTKTSGRYSLLRLAATLPALIGLVCAFSFTTRAAEIRIPETEKAPADEMKPDTENLRKVQITVSKDGEPLPGAIIIVTGSNKGVVSNQKGNASIDVQPGSTLMVSYVGCESQEIKVSDKTPEMIYVTLKSGSEIEKVTVTDEKRNDAGISGKEDAEPKRLYIVDGVERSDISDIDPETIAHIKILKDASATALYGSRGKHGVVVITTKGSKSFREEATLDPKNGTIETASAANEDKPFIVSETMPSFRGGDLNAFRAWVQENLRYPAEAIAKNIQGRVILSFVIEKDGSVSNVQLLHSPHQSLSDEARRVVESSPKWTPGEQRGQIVRVKFTLPVDFRMGQTTDKSAEKAPAGEPFIIAEQMPKFQNGDLNTFRAWVQQRVRYPSEAMAQKLYGRVVASFVIGKDGSVGDIRVLESPGKVLSDEVRRVIASSPNWEPGMQRGEKVAVKYTLPIDFAIQTDEAILRDKSASEVKGDIDEIMVIGFGGAAKTDKNQQPKPTADAGRTTTDDSRAVSLAERFGSEYGALIAQKKVAIGMDRKMCREALGEPTNSSKVTGQGKITEVWFYRNAQIALDFAGDRLVRWAGAPASRKHLARK